jgi:hypothetical protein
LNGVLIDRSENFFTSTLAKECTSSNFTTFSQSLNGTSIMATVADNQTVDYCDYFEVGTGYQFTQADCGIGLVVLQDRVDAASDLYYKSITSLPSTLNWAWSELAALVNEIKPLACDVASGPSSVIDEFWSLIAVPWADFQAAANISMNVEEWTKEELKTWISNYVQYITVVEAFITSHADSVSIVNGSVIISNVTVVNASASAPIIDIASIISFVESLNLTESEVVSFTGIWSTAYDLANVTVSDIIADLSATSTIVTSTFTWFEAFFGVQGFYTVSGSSVTEIEQEVTTSISGFISSSGLATLEAGLPAELQAIISWIEVNVEAELSKILPAVVFPWTVIPVVVVNSTNSINSTNATILNTTGSGSAINSTN